MSKIILLPILLFSFTFNSCALRSKSIPVDTAPMAGNNSAPTEIIIFSDFQCSFCKKAARELQRLLISHPNRLKVYFKHFPLQYHEWAQKAAQAAEAARLQNKFWEMHDLIFAHAEALNDDSFIMFANELELNMEKFTSDMYSSGVVNKVNADKADGERLGVTGTPYFFVNKSSFHGSYIDLKNEL